jgi:ABC-type bacteriocin/lantibiotic exporter with double-glycine peptidase domain
MSREVQKHFLVFLASMFLCVQSLYGDEVQRITGCGEDCVKIICAFYDISYDESKLVALLKPNEKHEVTLDNLENCVKKQGLNSLPFKGNTSDLLRIDRPMILHVKTEYWQHYLVAMKNPITHKLIAYDPIRPDPYELDMGKFSHAWSGVGLVVFPKQKWLNDYFILVIVLACILLGFVVGVRVFAQHANKK